MCIFLSITLIGEVVEELAAGGYEKDTPIAVVARATWPDEQIIRGTLETIEQQVKAANIDHTALIIVGHNEEYEKSRLYAKDFSHKYRKNK